MGSPTHDGHHIYQSVDLKPGQIQEVIIKNNDPHSILTWDFDVVRSNLKFTVYRTSETISTAITGNIFLGLKLFYLKIYKIKTFRYFNRQIMFNFGFRGV